jgi:hypothetical protein
MLGGRDRQEQFKQFLSRAGRGDDIASAIKDSFGMSLDTQTPAGLRLLKGAELEAVRNNANFYAIINLNSYAKLTLAGKSKIGYREVYVIDLQPASGAVDRLFVDAESYLPVRMNTMRIHGGASVPVEIYFDDWREADGLKMPHVIKHSFQKRTMMLTVTEIKNNAPVDAGMFEKP